MEINSPAEMKDLGKKIGKQLSSKGKPNFIHADAYRLLDTGVESFTDLDFESYLPSSVFVIEWGAPFVTTLTDQYLDIQISNGSTETARKVEITPIGQRWSGFKV